MGHDFVCWRCGAPLAALTLPFTRTDECKSCQASLHVCKLCEFHDPTVAKQCREPIAEEVGDKLRANFCDYFQPRLKAHSNRQHSQSEQARAQLDSLFGGGAKSPDALIDKPSDAQLAKTKLDELFGKRRSD